MSKQPSDTAPTPRVTLGRDENDHVIVRVEFRQRKQTVCDIKFPLAEISQKAEILIRAAGQVGICLLTTAEKNRFFAEISSRVQARQKSGNTESFMRPSTFGWRGPAFVTPAKVYGGEEQAILSPVTIDRPERWGQMGELESWRAPSRTFLRSNPIAAFCITLPFLPPIMQLIQMNTVGFQLVGGSRTGKSSLAALAGSIWGGHAQYGFIDGCKTTAEALEPWALSRNGLFGVLDETHLLDGDPKKRAYILKDLIFRLAEGREKRRGTEIKPLGTWQFAYLVTSNLSVHDMMSAGGSSYDVAAGARLIEVPCDREHGVFDVIPADTTPAEMSNKLRRLASTHYGVAIDRFLRRLVKARAADEQQLLERIERYREKITQAIEVDNDDGMGASILDALSAVYAAGRLAYLYRATRLDPKSLKNAIETCFQLNQDLRRRQGQNVDLVDLFRRELSKSLDGLVDLRGSSNGERRGIAGDGAHGYRLATKGGGEEFAFTPTQMAALCRTIGGVNVVARRLQCRGLLNCDRGQNPKTSTKRDPLGTGRERFYCVRAEILDKG